jgi:hypothetical protein
MAAFYGNFLLRSPLNPSMVSFVFSSLFCIVCTKNCKFFIAGKAKDFLLVMIVGWAACRPTFCSSSLHTQEPVYGRVFSVIHGV